MSVITISQKQSRVVSFGFAFLFAGLMVLSAQIRIPLLFTPVPMTTQTLVLFLSLIVLGRRAALSQSLYLVLGLSGCAVFANGGFGLAYLAGPTGGYLLGFLLVAILFPYFAPKKFSFSNSILFFTLAAIVVYASGLLWLISLHQVPFSTALIVGVYPFLPGEVLKIVCAAFCALRFKQI